MTKNEIALKQSLFIVMGSLFHDARQHLDKKFKKYDLTRSEWLILGLLRVNAESVSQSYAKSYLGVEASYFTKILNALEKKNFIIRQIDPNDRRNRIIKLNPKSSQKIKKIFEIIYHLNNTVQIDLNEKQMLELHNALAAISKRLKEFQT